MNRFNKLDISERPDVTSAISHATCTTAHDLGAAAIITDSTLVDEACSAISVPQGNVREIASNHVSENGARSSKAVKVGRLEFTINGLNESGVSRV